MGERQFNLIDDPWIKVIDQDSQTQMIGLNQLFAHANRYQRLAGDTSSQDLAVLRLLLAVLHTVYSRVDAEDKAYEWLSLNPKTWQLDDAVDDDDSESIVIDLEQTWQTLFENKKFTPAVLNYLHVWHTRFDFFGERPFLQVTQDEYDHFVLEKKRVATGTGTVAVKQIDRRVSESANSPAIFAPKAGNSKTHLTIDELIRWLIAYQNYTGVTDKTKVVMDDKYSTSPGWLYKLNPVFANGRNLFETLMLNLALINPNDPEYQIQRPQWECLSTSEYIQSRKRLLLPDNLAELYTTWSRMLHIEWDEDETPAIFSAGIPMFDNTDAFIEPMTTWREDKKAKPPVHHPATKRLENLNRAMWRSFGDYIRVSGEGKDFEPGIVRWLRRLDNKNLVPDEMPISLKTIGLVSDGNATSQSPAAEFSDDLQLDADVLFDSDTQSNWPTRIEDIIELTQTVGKFYWSYGSTIASLRNLDGHDFANQQTAIFYEALNAPFKKWLAELTGQDNRDEKIEAWKHELAQLVSSCAENLMQQATPVDMRGKVTGDKGQFVNIFTANNRLQAKVHVALFGKR